MKIIDIVLFTNNNSLEIYTISPNLHFGKVYAAIEKPKICSKN